MLSRFLGYLLSARKREKKVRVPTSVVFYFPQLNILFFISSIKRDFETWELYDNTEQGYRRERVRKKGQVPTSVEFTSTPSKLNIYYALAVISEKICILGTI